MQLGIFSDVISGGDPEEVAARTRVYGFECVQLRLNVPGVDLSTEGITDADASRVWRAFGREGVSIAGLAAYTNLTHPDPEQRRRNVESFRNRIRWATAFGATVVTTETGTFNPTSEWDADPYNDTEEAWQQLLDILAPCVRDAEEAGVVIALEAYVENVMNTATRARAAVDHFGRERVQVVMDPNNYLRPEDLERQDDVLRDVFATLGAGDQIVRRVIALAHAKDVRPPALGKRKCELPRAGTGVLNWPLFVSLLRESGFNGPLILEHLQESEVPETLAFVQQQVGRAAGV